VAGLGWTALAQAPVTAPATGAPQAQPTQPLSPNQLNDLVAPIALYPDPLLGQVLAASTYPLELMEAKQWVAANPTLQGQQLTDAARKQPWDASIQALVAFPDALNRMTENIQWTTALGNAFLAQQADVMAAVQRMRVQAENNGKLQSSPQNTVTNETENGQSDVVIQPAQPDVIYVPTYDPDYIWGPPAWGYYPALWYPSYGFWWGPGFNLGFCFGGWGGWGFGFGGFGWGWGMNWWGHGLFVNGGFFNHYGYGYGYGPEYYDSAYAGYYNSPVAVVYPQQEQAQPTTTVYVERAHPMMHEYDQYGQEIRPQASPASSPLYLIAFKDHSIQAAASYRVDGRTLHYVTLQHEEKQASLDALDRDFTQQLNRERGVQFSLPQ